MLVGGHTRLLKHQYWDQPNRARNTTMRIAAHQLLERFFMIIALRLLRSRGKATKSKYGREAKQEDNGDEIAP